MTPEPIRFLPKPGEAGALEYIAEVMRPEKFVRCAVRRLPTRRAGKIGEIGGERGCFCSRDARSW